mgnify:CR=1 FL=1
MENLTVHFSQHFLPMDDPLTPFEAAQDFIDSYAAPNPNPSSPENAANSDNAPFDPKVQIEVGGALSLPEP